MTLRSGTSLWLAEGPAPIETEALAGDISCEVSIVGGGITGALIGYHLVRAGIDTVLLDKRPLGTGSTAASTGLLQYEVDTPLVALIKMSGLDRALHAYRRGLTAIDQLEAIVAELDDPCGFERRDSLYFASHWWHRRRLRQEYECRRQHGFDVQWLDAKQLGDISSIKSRAAIRSTGDAQINPYRFTQELLAWSRSRGLRCWGETEVLSIDEAKSPVRLTTIRGTVSAQRVVYATGYDSRRYLTHDPGSLHCTFAVASEPIELSAGWPDRALIWETARPYFYARQTMGGRVIIGGEDTRFSTDHRRDSLIDAKAGKLIRRLHQLFPAIHFEPAYAWAGTFGESADGLAYIGQPADRPHAYFAIGYGGNGITFSAIASKLITDLYLRKPNADAEVFAFGR